MIFILWNFRIEFKYDKFYIKKPFVRERIGFFTYGVVIHRIKFCSYCKEFYHTPIFKNNFCDCYYV